MEAALIFTWLSYSRTSHNHEVGNLSLLAGHTHTHTHTHPRHNYDTCILLLHFFNIRGCIQKFPDWVDNEI